MSYADGWAALNLEMPARVPRTEYSADFHYDLIARVTGHKVSQSSPQAERDDAADAFMAAWDYAFVWSTLIGGEQFGNRRTWMGHAEYASERSDYSERVGSAFSDFDQVLNFDPVEAFGVPDRSSLVQGYEQHVASQLLRWPDVVPFTGVYISCVSGLIDLFGWDLLLGALAEDAERMGEMVHRYGRWILPYFQALAEADVPCAMVHDDIVWSSGPFVHPDWYRKYVFPNLARCIAPVVESGKRVLFTADGDYTLFLQDIADCGIHGFVMEPMTDLELACERYGRTHAVVGNVDTRVLLSGDSRAIEYEVARCMRAGKSCPGFMLAVGNHIPPNTPVESCLIYDAAYRAMRDR